MSQKITKKKNASTSGLKSKSKQKAELKLQARSPKIKNKIKSVKPLMVSNKVKAASVGYFCMEFGLHEDFPIYSGGLGILAGDYLKAAKDLKKNVVGVGILWRQGYNKQVFDQNGTINDCYPEYRYQHLKDTKVTVTVNIRGRDVVCKVWLCECYGNVPLYLLDTFLPENADWSITGQLYGWFSEERIAQEMVLGIGGFKALQALGKEPEILHFNEGHALFAGLELVRQTMEKQKLTFDQALKAIRPRIVFTTHTPVAAGNEVHDHALLNYMGAYNGLSQAQMIKLGGNPFNMTVAALRMAKLSNAVAELHRDTAQKMWQDVTGISKIIGITNGVHNGTWQTSFDEKLSDDHFWKEHQKSKKDLFDEIKTRNGFKLDPNVLTIGFARRAAPYKRADLIFSKINVIETLLMQNKVQLIFSGKAHPNDMKGKQIVQKIYEMSKKYPGKIIFIQNYDMKIGRLLTRGCDVWLNNPIRPLEACGTSGMKAAMNGVLNLSVLDGWWPEGCVHDVNGWQIGNAYEGKDQDKVDAKSLYDILIKKVIPRYYDDKQAWIEMMKNSRQMSSYQFSAARMVEDYFDKLYK